MKKNLLTAAILSTAFILPTISFSSDCVDDVKKGFGARPLQVIIASKLMRQDIDPNNHRMRHYCDQLVSDFLCPLSAQDSSTLDTQVVNKLVVHFSEGLMNALEYYRNPVERMVFVKGAVQRDLDDVEAYRDACVRLSYTFTQTGENRPRIFSSLLKGTIPLPELASFARVASDYSDHFMWTKTTDPVPLFNFVALIFQEERKVFSARTKGMHEAERIAHHRRICEYLQISPDAPPEGVTARDKYAESFLRIAKPLLEAQYGSVERGIQKMKRLLSIPIEERERAFAEVTQSLVYLHAGRLSQNQQRTYWDQALDLPADERRAYLTQLDEVIKVVGMNQVSHIEELVQAVDAATPEKRSLIQKYTQRIAAEFPSHNTRRNLVTALVYCGWRNAEECEVFVNAAVTLIRAFDKADISQASAYKLLRELKHHNSAYTDPSFVPDLLPSLFALRDVYCAQLMQHLDGADSASRKQISRLVTEAFKDKCGSMLEVLKLINVGNLECVIKALRQIESAQEREEIVRIASPFVPHMRLAWQYAEVIEALPSIASEKREEFVIRCVAAVQEHKENKRRLVAAIREAKKMLSGTSLAKRGRDEQAVSVGASSSSSSSSSSVVDDVEEIVDAPLVASLSSSASSDESDDEGTTSLKKARRN